MVCVQTFFAGPACILLFVLLLSNAIEVQAPSQLPSTDVPGVSQGARLAGLGAAAAAAASAVALAAAARMASTSSSSSELQRIPRHLRQTQVGRQSGRMAKPVGGSLIPDAQHQSLAGSSSGDDGEEDDWNELDHDVDSKSEDECVEVDSIPAAHGGKGGASGKLWTKVQFPEGTSGAANYDMANLQAAQSWECPCTDRRNCIGSERITNIFQLYEYRKHFRTTAAQKGGLRDACRKEMDERLDPSTRSFTRTFKVGVLVDCCAASAGLAKGLSFATYSASRADSRKSRPMHEGRINHTTRAESEERAHLNAYIRGLRDSMEGPKGGSDPIDKWRTAKMSMPKRWQQYKEGRTKKGLPIIGSQELFKVLWAEHDEIRETTAKGHAKCDRCGHNHARRLEWAGRNDTVALDALEEVDADQVRALKRCTHRFTCPPAPPLLCAFSSLPACLSQLQHDQEHRGERDYAEDIWLKAEERPHKVTAFSMDAPTETQLDVPVQKRAAHDPVKSLDKSPKWSSKLMGLLIAGHGMCGYLVRDGLGSGPNLSCTVLYLGLVRMVKAARPLGNVFNVLLDNTGADNKNNEVIFFLAWLVLTDVFEESSAFFMIKGHTYSRIDQTFRALIGQLLGVAVWTVSMLLHYIFTFLKPYNCLGVEELDHLWDWVAFFQPHVHERFTGFGTGQFGSGMHEIVLRKNANGVVCAWFRKSSAASNWLPEGDGYPVFKSTPAGIPPIAKGKTDSKWSRSGVEETVRAWFRYMGVNEATRTKLQQEWETRFASLPPDGDTSQLSEAAKLKWSELPSREHRVATIHGMPAPPSKSDLENPEVNPITGHGRTAADVQREHGGHKLYLRELHRDSQLPAIFQADFLLVQLPGRDVALHRVVGGLFLDDAVASDLSFTTAEYMHTPQEGFTELFGLFTPQLNPDYDPSNKKSGTKFMRHHNIGRNVILVYNVRVSTVTMVGNDVDPRAKTAVRISLESLRALARTRPVYSLPDKLPESHVVGEQPADKASQKHKRAENAAQPPSQRDVEPSASSEDDDPPAPIPDGWEAVPWMPGVKIVDFMLWTKLDGAKHAAWHRMIVLKELSTNRCDGYTHDAAIFNNTGKRGVRLSAEAYTTGCWVMIREKGAPSETRTEPQKAAAAARPAPRATKKKTVQPQPERERLRRRNTRENHFVCQSCHLSDEFLWCSPTSPDGQIPTLKCQRCCPAGWVTISRTDFLRSLPS